jgi:hypothetical protein
MAAGRDPNPSAAVLDGRTPQSVPASGGWAGCDGPKRRGGSRVRAAVGTLGHRLALEVTAASAQERDQAAEVQAVRGQAVRVALVGRGQPAAGAARHGTELVVVARAEPGRGFVLLPERRVVERAFGWLARFRRLARDCERTAAVLAGWHRVALVALLLRRISLPPVPSS